MLAGAIAAVLGSALRGRALAATGWSVLLLADLAAVLQQEVQQMGSRFVLGTGSLTVDAQAAILPLLALGLASAFAMRPRGPRHVLGGGLAIAAAWAAAVAARSESHSEYEAPVVGVAIVGLALLLPLAVAAAALVRRRPRELASATLVLAVAAPELVWIATGLLTYRGPVVALALLGVQCAVATLVVLRLARLAGRAAVPG